jgi:hypothetical protein
MAKPILNQHSARFAFIGWRAFLFLLVFQNSAINSPLWEKWRRSHE